MQNMLVWILVSRNEARLRCRCKRGRFNWYEYSLDVQQPSYKQLFTKDESSGRMRGGSARSGLLVNAAVSALPVCFNLRK